MGRPVSSPPQSMLPPDPSNLPPLGAPPAPGGGGFLSQVFQGGPNREERADKAMDRSVRYAKKGKTKKSARKAKKALRLKRGERVGPMRWLLGKGAN